MEHQVSTIDELHHKEQVLSRLEAGMEGSEEGGLAPEG